MMTDEELIKHYGIDKEEPCYGYYVAIGKECLGIAIGEFIKKDAKQQRTIIDYDDECQEFVVRTYPMNYGGKESELRISDEEQNNLKEPLRTMRTLTKGTELPEGAIQPLP